MGWGWGKARLPPIMRNPRGCDHLPQPPSNEPPSPATRQGREKGMGASCPSSHFPAYLSPGPQRRRDVSPWPPEHLVTAGILVTIARNWEYFWEQQEPAGGCRSSAAIFTGLDLAQDLEARH